MSNNIVRAEVEIEGVRPLLQHRFGPDALPLEKAEKTGVAGNDPEEWHKTKMVTPEGQLYVGGEYIFATVLAGSKHTKKGKGSIQSNVAATLQVEQDQVLLDGCFEPIYKDKNTPSVVGADVSRDSSQPVYLDVRGVRNPSTKGRNVRYRLAAKAGWKAKFTLLWDKTIVPREQMKAVLNDAGTLVGLADGRTMGNGRFKVNSFVEL